MRWRDFQVDDSLLDAGETGLEVLECIQGGPRLVIIRHPGRCSENAVT